MTSGQWEDRSVGQDQRPGTSVAVPGRVSREQIPGLANVQPIRPTETYADLHAAAFADAVQFALLHEWSKEVGSKSYVAKRVGTAAFILARRLGIDHDEARRHSADMTREARALLAGPGEHLSRFLDEAAEYDGEGST